MQEFLKTIQELWASWHNGVFPDLGVWSYVILAILVATEGPLSTLIGAAGAAAGYLDIEWVFIAAAIGNITGDILWYTVGYAGNKQLLLKYGAWLGLQERHLDRLEAEMHSHATKLLVVAKIAFGLIIPTLVAAGLARVPWRRWFPIVFAAETIWTIIIVSTGYYAAGAISQLEQGIRIIGFAALGVFVLALYLLIRRRVKKAAAEPIDPVSVPKQLPSNIVVNGTTNGYAKEPTTREEPVQQNPYKIVLNDSKSLHLLL